eukprot:CAMPEP_0118953478 /NCGR_PEP_ID=MMETSP1169-20130426/56633_1 /TAXON_ID=36882 /ORGANISM="Pyramimonas obovata, Strain CCMP722" /LENGTH=562 /DNA_ID=CAMNT_0006900945 /DNA_START=431 /DNA_END=2116 /DNA_ORIENTATION=+
MVHYAAPDTRWHVQLNVMFALVTSASVVALVPFDIYTTLQDHHLPVIQPLWNTSYWLTQLLTWLILPIHQIYADAGDFTVMSRLNTAVRENLIFYSVIGFLSGVGVIFLVFVESITIFTLAQSGMAISNMFGITTGMFLMGYGLVEIPRLLLRKADAAYMLQRSQQRVAELSDELEEAHKALAHSVLVVQTTANTMPRRHPLRWAMDVIDKEATELVPMRLAGDMRFEEMGEDVDYDFDEEAGLAALRRRLKRTITVYMRTKYQYQAAVRSAFKYEDIVENVKRAQQGSRWRFRPVGASPGGTVVAEATERLLFLWKCVVRAPLLQVTAAVLAVASGAVVLAESTIWFKYFSGTANLSVFSHIIAATREANQVAVQVLVMLPLMYMCICTYFSLFKLAKFKFFSLTAHSSDAFSLLLSGSLVCRYGAPLCYNFMTLLPVVTENGRQTVFDKMQGFGSHGTLSLIISTFPLVLPFYCALVAFNTFNRIAENCCGCCFGVKRQYNFNEEVANTDMYIKGGQILTAERQNQLAGLPIGDGILPASGAATPTHARAARLSSSGGGS